MSEGLQPAFDESCPHCGGDASDNHFDRSLCACDAMHTCCNNCGNPLDYCPYARPVVVQIPNGMPDDGGVGYGTF